MSESESEPRQVLHRPNRLVWGVVGAAVVVVLALVWWKTHRPAPPPAPEPVAAPAVAPAPPPAPAAAPCPAAPASPQQLLEAISGDATYRGWLARGDVPRRWAVLTDNLAEGVSPRRELAFLAPKKPFTVAQRGEVSVIDPESYHRYDAFADVVATVDPEAAARAYRALHGALEAAYRALGYPHASLDRVTARALKRIVGAPVVDGDVPVLPDGGLYAFEDPKLEALPEVEKHLLRMGPRNTRVLQKKARDLQRALGLAPEPAKAAKR